MALTLCLGFAVSSTYLFPHRKCEVSSDQGGGGGHREERIYLRTNEDVGRDEGSGIQTAFQISGLHNWMGSCGVHWDGNTGDQIYSQS